MSELVGKLLNVVLTVPGDEVVIREAIDTLQRQQMLVDYNTKGNLRLIKIMNRQNAELAELENPWISVEDRLPPPHENFLALNSDGRMFDSRMCYGMHKPWFTYPKGYASASDTAPSWIDVTHWMPLEPPGDKK